MPVPEWNAEIITPDSEASAEIISGGGLEKDSAGAIGVKVDNSTITINSAGALQANGGGGSVVVDTSSPLSGEGTSASPLGLSIDTSSLDVTSGGANRLKVKNPLPAASVSDAGKVLSVNSSGSAGWEASKSLVAGSGISITESSGVVTIAASGGGGSGTVSTSNFIFGDGSSDAPLYVGVDGSSVSGKTALVKTYTREVKTSGGNTYYMGCSPLVYDEANEVFHLDSTKPFASWPGSYGSTANVLFYNHEDPTEYATCSVGIAATSGSAESSYVLGAWDTVTQNTVPGDLQYWTYVGSGTLTLDKLKTFWCCLHIAGSTDPGNQGSPAGTFCINMDYAPGYAANVLTVTDSARVPTVTSGNTGKVLTVTGNSTFGWAAAPSAALSHNSVSMTLSSGKLTCSGITGGKGWYIGTLRIGMGSAPVTGPVTGTTVCIYGYTNDSYSSFCGSGSVINLQYYPVAEIQFMFCLGSNSDTGIAELNILDSTGADITATLATGVTSRLEYWKIST